MTNPAFEEVQKFKTPVVMVFLAIPTILVCYKLFTSHPKLPFLFSLFVLLIVGTIFLIANLHTMLSTDGIMYHFKPFHFKQRNILWKNVASIYVREYEPLLEYGGYGWRVLGIFGKGKAFNVAGTWGIQIVFTNGKKLLLGTQHPNEAETWIESNKHLIKE